MRKYNIVKNLIPLIVFVVLFILSKIILNLFNMEYLSWVYYLVVEIIFLYLLLIISKYILSLAISKVKKILNICVTIFILTMFFFSIYIPLESIFIGHDIKLKNHPDLVKSGNIFPLGQFDCYEYINFAIRGTDHKICINMYY